MPLNEIIIISLCLVYRVHQRDDAEVNSEPSEAVESPSLKAFAIQLQPNLLSKLTPLWVGGGRRGPPEVPFNIHCPADLLCETGAAMCTLDLDSVPSEKVESLTQHFILKEAELAMCLYLSQEKKQPTY